MLSQNMAFIRYMPPFKMNFGSWKFFSELSTKKFLENVRKDYKYRKFFERFATDCVERCVLFIYWSSKATLYCTVWYVNKIFTVFKHQIVAKKREDIVFPKVWIFRQMRIPTNGFLKSWLKYAIFWFFG